MIFLDKLEAEPTLLESLYKTDQNEKLINRLDMEEEKEKINQGTWQVVRQIHRNQQKVSI